MPLNTQVKRNGRTRKIRWGGFHVAAMTLAAALDSQEGELYDHMAKYAEEHDDPIPSDEDGPITISPSDVWNLMGYHVIAATPLNNGSYVMQSTIKFVDVTDGEVFELRKGDELLAWRNSW